MAKGGLMGELWRYARRRKKYWLVPLIFLMLALAGLLVLAQGSALAPFIYTIF
jgi:hydrogenase/urease accessory protein HupE